MHSSRRGRQSDCLWSEVLFCLARIQIYDDIKQYGRIYKESGGEEPSVSAGPSISSMSSATAWSSNGIACVVVAEGRRSVVMPKVLLRLEEVPSAKRDTWQPYAEADAGSLLAGQHHRGVGRTSDPSPLVARPAGCDPDPWRTAIHSPDSGSPAVRRRQAVSLALQSSAVVRPSRRTRLVLVGPTCSADAPR